MSTLLHLIRPSWLVAIIPFVWLMVMLMTNSTARSAWKKACDAHLLTYLSHSEPTQSLNTTALIVGALLLCLILSLSGPSLYQQMVPVYHNQQAQIVLLDLSTDMLATDLSPNRLARAKFKLGDLFSSKKNGQFALIAYTSEAFVVSPLTDDAQTILALLPELLPQMMPVNGNQLESALAEAHRLMRQTNFSSADILVMTGKPPSLSAIQFAAALAKQGSDVSILPTLAGEPDDEFKQFAAAGHGTMIPFSHTQTDLNDWLIFTKKHQQVMRDSQQKAAVRRDDGRWLLLPAIGLFLLLFQRHRLENLRT